MISDWNKVDLHIHSYESNKIKNNDFKLPYRCKDGTEIKLDNAENYLDALIEKIKTDEINIFSITDHNIINFEVYDKLLNEYQDILKDLNSNFLCGIEIDVKDKLISKPFHMLIIFKEYNRQKLEQFLEKLNEKKKDVVTGKVNIDEKTNWTLNEIFSSMFDSNVEEFMLIPHYNEKHKKIKSGELDNLARPLTIFSAFEDGNNFTKLQNSIKIYLSHGITNFPAVAFSDWHNKPGENKVSCTNLLGNNKYPFNTLKLSFNDAEMRVSLHNVKNTRDIEIDREYIKEINIGEKKIELSPYQNTIIGGFGSGKSFLGTVLLGREEIISEKYAQFTEQINNVSFKLNSGVEFKNLLEYKTTQKGKLNLIELKQGNALYTSNQITSNIKDSLKEEIQLEFPSIVTDYSKNIDGCKKRATDIGNKIESVMIDKTTESKIQLELLSNVVEFPIITNNEKKVIDNEEKLRNKTDLVETMLSFEEMKLFGDIKLFEKEYFQHMSDSIKQKIDNAEEIIELVKAHFSTIDTILNNYITDIQKKTNGKAQQVQRLSSIEDELKVYTANLSEFAADIKSFENFYSKEKITEELSKCNEVQISPSFKGVVNFKDTEIKTTLMEAVLKKTFRNSHCLFDGIMQSVLREEKFHNNASLSKLLSEYTVEISSLFNERYDILNSENESIIAKSPGGRAIMLMEIILEKVEHINDDKLNILFIDQPEDQLDNKNIYDKIVTKVRKSKYLNRNIQIFFISHNANISITSDSENIIIANKENNGFKYIGGGLEGDTHVKSIADILEGGLDALEQRGIKLNVKYYKEKWS